MANKRARDRQLAKLAARRQAERRAQERRRALIVGGIIGLLVIGLAVAAVAVWGGDDTQAGAGPTPAASPAPDASASPELCSAKAPKSAGEKKPTFDEPPEMTVDPKATYTATLKTSCGTVELELYPDVAPIGVNSFVFLARQGFYDGLTFHRIIAGFVVQGGDPAGDGTGGPGYEFANEISKKVTFDDAGILAYANSGPDTNGSQFFITLGPKPELDPTADTSYTIFGKVTGGMDVVQTMGALPTTGDAGTPTQPVYIDSITIDEKR